VLNAALSGGPENAQQGTALALIGRGADVHRSDRRGRTALHAAAFFGCHDALLALLARGAAANAVDTLGLPPIFFAVALGNADCVRSLLQVEPFAAREYRVSLPPGFSFGAPPTAADAATPLETAALTSTATATPTSTSSCKFTPIRPMPSARTVRTGAPSPTEESELVGYSLLHVASGCGRARVCEVLCALGAEVDAPLPISGRTALILACAYERDETLTVLLNAGATLQACDRYVVFSFGT
jgi:hypothetical protein